MKAIKIYTQDSKYFMEDLDTNVTTELTNVTKDGISFILPENSANRNFCSIKRAEKGITLEYKETRTLNTEKSTTPRKSAPKFNPEDYLDEKQIEKRRKLLEEVAKIDAIAEAEYKRAQTLDEIKNTIKNFTPEMIAALKATLNGEG